MGEGGEGVGAEEEGEDPSVAGLVAEALEDLLSVQTLRNDN